MSFQVKQVAANIQYYLQEIFETAIIKQGTNQPKRTVTITNLSESRKINHLISKDQKDFPLIFDYCYQYDDKLTK